MNPDPSPDPTAAASQAARPAPAPAPATVSSGRWRAALGLGGWLLFTFAATIGGLVGAPGEWYAALDKPAWTPPGWVFGPAWTLLYTMMAVAAWLVWLRGGFGARRVELTAYLVQWFLNALWTPLFFGLQLPGWALVDIVLLWLAAALTMILFFRARRLAGWLLVPYLLWLGFATALNAAIWQMN